MQQFILVQLIYLGRIIAAGICGVIIGWERQNRMKAAGVRTHFIIAVTSALMVIVSKYGFGDALTAANTSVDVSRVASGILAGVGIMGGGLVITGKQGFTSGLTTAAGIWATVAIGMSLGAGMYIIGGASTVILLFGQIFMHKNIKLFKSAWRGQIEFLFNDKNDIDKITSLLEAAGVEIIHMKCEIKSSENERLKIIFAVSTEKKREELADMITDIPNVYSYEF